MMESLPPDSPPPRPRRTTLRKIRLFLRFMLLCVGLPLLCLFAYVRGPLIGPPPAGPALDALIAAETNAPPWIQATADLERLGLVAAGLTAEEGGKPGPFRVLFLPELDNLEKFHHLMHGPCTGITRMYCDIWVNSVTTYGKLETTWGWEPVFVRPSLKLPILMFLLDRLIRGKSAFQATLEAPQEAVRGMEMHTLPGRVALWKRVLAHCRRHPSLVPFVRAQLKQYERDWSDSVESEMWGIVTTLKPPGILAQVPKRPPAAVQVTGSQLPALFDRLLADRGN
jgi:hypothetical protein